jgi:hypothetical protein
LGSRTLFLDCGRDRGRDLVHFADGAADALDGVDRLSRNPLNIGDLFGDLVGRLGGLARQ